MLAEHLSNDMQADCFQSKAIQAPAMGKQHMIFIATVTECTHFLAWTVLLGQSFARLHNISVSPW